MYPSGSDVALVKATSCYIKKGSSSGKFLEGIISKTYLWCELNKYTT